VTSARRAVGEKSTAASAASPVMECCSGRARTAASHGHSSLARFPAGSFRPALLLPRNPSHALGAATADARGRASWPQPYEMAQAVGSRREAPGDPYQRTNRPRRMLPRTVPASCPSDQAQTRLAQSVAISAGGSGCNGVAGMDMLQCRHHSPPDCFTLRCGTRPRGVHECTMQKSAPE
jgi:hypothetical protein